MVADLREQLFAELGVPLPVPRVSVRADLPERHAVLSLHEVPAKILNVPREMQDQQAAALVCFEVLALLRQRASDFITLAVTQRLLDELEQIAPAAVRNVVPKPVSVPLLRDVLRRLVEERVSVRDLQAVLEALSSSAPTEKDAQKLTEFVRSQLSRAISFRLNQGQSAIGVILVDAIIEDTIRRAIMRSEAGAFLTLPPQAARDVHQAIKRALAPLPPEVPRVFLTQPDVRRFLWQLIKIDLPDAVVVSYSDLLPSIALTPVARVTPGT
jgi:type III secretion protein V